MAAGQDKDSIQSDEKPHDIEIYLGAVFNSVNAAMRHWLSPIWTWMTSNSSMTPTATVRGTSYCCIVTTHERGFT
ncbi:MAG: hypothetical protein ACI9A2_004590 [Halioglobus sp.]|jgi:hypothetical protein